MKNFYKVILAVMLCFIICSPDVYASVSDTSLPLHIGLEYKYKGVTAVPISNTSISVGYEINGAFSSEAVLYNKSSVSMNVSNTYMVRVDTFYDTYDACKTASDALNASGLNTFPASTGIRKWAVYAGGFGNPSEASAYGEKIGKAVTVLNPTKKRLELRSGDSILIVFECEAVYPQIAGINNEFITLGDRTFRGRIEFGRYASGNMTAVNVLSIDEYLYSVVPSEMYYTYPMEALKAQATASRSYSFTRYGVHSTEGYGLCDSTHCQVYRGTLQEKESCNAAVDLTTGLLIYYQNEIINATYFASSGGVTEDSENVWINNIPYLRAADSYELNPKNWSRTYTLSDLTSILNSNKANIGNAVDMKITSYSLAGRVNQLQIIGTSGTKTLSKEEIRTYFAPLGGPLESRNFQLITGSGTMDNYVSLKGDPLSASKSIKTLYLLSANNGTAAVANGDKTLNAQGLSLSKSFLPSTSVSATAETGTFLINGLGAGHGVGMSQEGARTMAEQGKSFIEILTHYYTGVSVVKK